jgi:hypothetical protein
MTPSTILQAGKELLAAKTVREILLICGIAGPLLFVGIDLFAGTLWKGYSFFSQSISELSAIGAPTRPLVVPLDIARELLITAFGTAVWVVYSQNWALRLTAGLLIANAVLGLAILFFPMHVDQPASHNVVGVALGALSLLCFVLAIGFGAAAFRNWFRFYSIGTLAVFLVLTILGIWVVPHIVAGQAASRVGIQERVMSYGCQLWLVILAILLLASENNMAGAVYHA